VRGSFKFQSLIQHSYGLKGVDEHDLIQMKLKTFPKARTVYVPS